MHTASMRACGSTHPKEEVTVHAYNKLSLYKYYLS